MEENLSVRSASAADLAGVTAFLQPFIDKEFILPRTSVDRTIAAPRVCR